MKQWEIIREAQENGAKIRHIEWAEHWYIKWDGVHWMDHKGDICITGASIARELELYVEPIRTFGPDRAMYWLERGKFVKRRTWTSAILWEDGYSIREMKSGFLAETANWFHNDWHLCDENGNYVPEPEEGK